MRAGEAFVAGRSRETARALLEAADRLGIAHAVVRTTDGGYVVPEEIVDELGNAPGIVIEAEVDQVADEKDAPGPGATGGDSEDADETEAPKAAEEIADDLGDQDSVFDVDAATYPRLKSEAARRKLPTSGNAVQLRARLRGETEGE